MRRPSLFTVIDLQPLLAVVAETPPLVDGNDREKPC